MATRKHIEIVGAGIAGLTAAAAFAQRGHSVRVHERTEDLREIGAGIYLKQNSLEVLKRLGVFPAIAAAGERLFAGEIRAEKDRLLIRRDFSREEIYTVLRGVLHGQLAEAARAAGAEIVTGSPVTAATADGEVVLEDGTRHKADLVIGADGVRSRVRESLGLTRSQSYLPDGAIRLLIDRRPEDLPGTSYENWSGPLRIGIAPCSANDIYIFMIGRAAEERASRVPVDHEYWIRSFPHLESTIRRIGPDVGRYGRHSFVTVKAWSRGRVAIIGDAAHAQPPNLGQGAGTSIANAEALAIAVDGHGDLAQALADWEASQRPVSEMVQRWSYRYGAIAYAWPSSLLGLRASFIRTVGAVGPSARRWGWLGRGGMDALPQAQ